MLLNIITSKKSDEEIQQELMDIVGWHNFNLCQQLIEHRGDIKVYVDNQNEKLAEEKRQNSQSYQGKNTAPLGPGISVQVEYKRGKGKKPKGQKVVDSTDNTKLSNYDLLSKLGFDDALIQENIKCGLGKGQAQPKSTYVTVSQFHK
jgi:hypothetical protein